ncbi:hypothetical protein [Miltoncostaea marina]|uniref:hypothetical protein n=1 Tax=Miltoncostaea marina TaxID=2843215 RepID=UPI001C3CD57E|nr:hypothetical protein [Miltoncostaea marina]
MSPAATVLDIPADELRAAAANALACAGQPVALGQVVFAVRAVMTPEGAGPATVPGGWGPATARALDELLQEGAVERLADDHYGARWRWIGGRS